MLQSLRKASKSWVATVIIGFLVLAFALWGVADIFQGGTDRVVADVGGVHVSDFDYDLQLKNQIRAISAQTQQDFTMEQAKAVGLDRSVLNSVISRAALDDLGDRLGLTATRTAVGAEMRANQNFRGPSGAFDPTQFLRVLQENGLSEEMFVNQALRDIARSQLMDATIGGLAAPPGLARLLYDFTNEERTAQYLTLTPEEAGAVAQPTDADLEAFHKAHSDQFTAPEYRAFDYVQIGPDEVARDIQVSEEDVKAEYEAHKSQYETPEQREVEQIRFPSKEAAEAAAARIKTPADFAAAAKDAGLKPEDLKLGTFAQNGAGLDAKLSQAVFAVPQGGVTPPVEGPFGWVILRAAKVIPGSSKSFDELQDAIRADLVKARSAGKLADLANMFEDTRGSGASLEEAAMKLNLTPHHIGAVDAQGNTPERTKADIPAEPELLQTVFQTETGEESDLFQAADGKYFAVKVTQITQPAVRPLDSVREEVRTAYLADARAKLLQSKIAAYSEQAMKAGNLADVAKAMKHTIATSKPLKRGQTDDIFSMEVLSKIFAGSEGAIVSGPMASGKGYVLARVVKITHPEPDVTSADYTNFRRSASQQLSATAADSLAAAARQEAGVNIHEATVRRVVGETAQ